MYELKNLKYIYKRFSMYNDDKILVIQNVYITYE